MDTYEVSTDNNADHTVANSIQINTDGHWFDAQEFYYRCQSQEDPTPTYLTTMNFWIQIKDWTTAFSPIPSVNLVQQRQEKCSDMSTGCWYTYDDKTADLYLP